MKITAGLVSGVEGMLRKSKVDVINGEARISGPDSVTVENRNITAKYIIIATGSYPKPPDLPFRKSNVVSVDQLFALKTLPTNVVVYGKGGVAAELAQFFNMAGSQVALISADDDFLPGVDTHVTAYLTKALEDAGIPIYPAQKIKVAADGSLSLGKNNIPCDVVINAGWRNAVLPAMDVDIMLNDAGYISTDIEFRTSIPNIFAVGDVNGLSYFAHVASAQGIWVINHIKGIRNAFNFKNYPVNIYTTPEIAQIGMTEQQLKEDGYDYRLNQFPLSANGKALAEGNAEGMVRILSEKRYGQVLGVQIIAANATDMIAEASAYMQIEGTVYDIAQTIHAHPTVSEIFMSAGFEAFDKAMRG
jgi:dihydrolipoamide dehydrogenase